MAQAKHLVCSRGPAGRWRCCRVRRADEPRCSPEFLEFKTHGLSSVAPRQALVNEETRTRLERIRSFAMPDGPVECRGTWLRQRGEMRMDADKPWLPFEAEQQFDGSGIDFRWRAWIRMAHLMPALVVDSFERGHGALTARVFGFIPVASSRGPDTDRGEAMRGLAELPWRPFAFRAGPDFTWEASSADKLRATFHDGKILASVEFRSTPTGGSSPSPPPIGRASSASRSSTRRGPVGSASTRHSAASGCRPSPRPRGICPKGRSPTGEVG
jgi:hypothetical protein